MTTDTIIFVCSMSETDSTPITCIHCVCVYYIDIWLVIKEYDFFCDKDPIEVSDGLSLLIKR